MKTLIAKETILTYPDFSKKFTIHTDASDVQMGAVIMQEGKPLAFYSQKLSKAQLDYTMIEKELLSIVENFKDFWNILMVHKIEVFTDHKNLTYEIMESASHTKNKELKYRNIVGFKFTEWILRKMSPTVWGNP